MKSSFVATAKPHRQLLSIIQALVLLAAALFAVSARADLPVINSISNNLAIGATQTAVIGVDATGSGLNYQWLRNGSAVTDTGRITGSQSAAITISTVTVSDSGSYSVVVSNVTGTATSGISTLTVVMPPIVSAITNRIVNGTNVVFTAAVTPVEAQYQASYFWNKEGVDLVTNSAHFQGVNTTNLTIVNANSSDTGSYQIAIFNLAGVATNNPDLGAGAVFAAPVIASATGDQSATVGDTVHFNVTTSAGTGPLTYQWRANFGNLTDNDTSVSGANTPSLTITASGAANYDVVVSNAGGQAVSTASHLSIATGAAINLQPSNTVAECGSPVTLTVGGVGAQPLTFQWNLNGSPIASATASTLTFTNAHAEIAGSYSVVVSNSIASVTSDTAVLTVSDTHAPVITLNGSAVTNITLSTYADPGATATDTCQGTVTVNVSGTVNTNVAGSYTLTYIASDSTGNNATNTRIVNVFNGPTIVTSPVAIHASIGDTATFTVVATGAPVLKYQWYEIRGASRIALAGKTTSTISFKVTSASQTLDYYAVVSNTSGKATSTVAHLTVDVAPVITVQPVTLQRLVAGNNATFHVTATGSAPLNYQWSFNGAAIAGESTATLIVTNIQSVNAGTYTVTVSNYTGVAVTSLTTHGILQILPDKVKPIVTVTAPAINAIVTNGQVIAGVTVPLINVSGTATDNGLITQIVIQRTSPITEGPLTVGFTGTNAGRKTFTNQFTLIEGTNTFEVTAVDSAGNSSSVVKRSVLYSVKSTLTLLTNGIGRITSTTGATNQAQLVIGRNYTVSAVTFPSSNWLFASWSAGPDLGSLTFLSTNANLTFRMTSGPFLRANFVTNPFTATVGSFNGLFFPTNGVTEDSSGQFNVTVASASKGAFTGKIYLAGTSHPVNGAFDLNGDSTVNVARPGKTPVTVRLHINLYPVDNQITGSVSNVDWFSPLYGELSQFSAISNPATNYSGRYTLQLTSNTGTPAGAGALTVTNNAAGTAVLAGTLSDSSAVTETVPVSKLGNVPFYSALYVGKGVIMGWLNFTTNAPRNISGTLSWIKPATGKVYPAGFTNTVNAVGNEYIIPTKGVRLFGISSGTVTLADGNLGSSLTYGISLATNNVVTVTGGSTNKLTVLFTATTGTFTFTFQPTGLRTLTTGHGTVLQGQNTAAGWFLGTNASGSFHLSAAVE